MKSQAKRTTKKSTNFRVRPRRLRRHHAIRTIVAETRLTPDRFVLPLFVTEGSNQREEIKSMPGMARLSIDNIIKLTKEAWSHGIHAVALFPHLEDDLKDSHAQESLKDDGLLQRCVSEIKNKLPEMCVITDVAMDPYSTDGHDGLVIDGHIDNDQTLDILAGMSLAQARAGADFVAPSDMMDGRIGYIRDTLDNHGFTNVGIISYAAKYASSFYGPFREALASAPKFGDKKTYQMDFRNQSEALREVRLDIQQGADIVMVKPALAYLDVIARIKDISTVPVAAYNVSGEYAMIKLMAEKGLIDASYGVIEVLTAIHRAGADLIFTYHAIEAAKIID